MAHCIAFGLGFPFASREARVCGGFCPWTFSGNYSYFRFVVHFGTEVVSKNKRQLTHMRERPELSQSEVCLFCCIVLIPGKQSSGNAMCVNSQSWGNVFCSGTGRIKASYFPPGNKWFYASSDVGVVSWQCMSDGRTSGISLSRLFSSRFQFFPPLLTWSARELTAKDQTRNSKS